MALFSILFSLLFKYQYHSTGSTFFINFLRLGSHTDSVIFHYIFSYFVITITNECCFSISAYIEFRAHISPELWPVLWRVLAGTRVTAHQSTTLSCQLVLSQITREAM